ncbi:MAG: OmpH family outer membrane protein [Treponematales bacterium]
MKRKLCAIAACLLAAGLHAQQLTRFAVIDLPRVYTAFFKDSRAVRDFEEKSAKVQRDIDKRSAEVQTLQTQRAEAEAAGDEAKALRLDADIYKRSEALREYYRLKTAELENEKKKLTQAGSFLDQVNSEVRLIAEAEGFSIVLSVKDIEGVLWYSPTIDITDRVIQSLTARAGR